MRAKKRIDAQPSFMLLASPWRESSLLIECYSRDFGRVSMIARSARKSQSLLRGCLVPFVPVQLSWFGEGELKTLHRAEWLGGWPQPQGRALLGCLYANELVLKLTATEDANADIFHNLSSTLEQLCQGSDEFAPLRSFEWRLLKSLGYAPDLHLDSDGQVINAQRFYSVAPLSSVQALQHRATGAVSGKTLLALRDNVWHDKESMNEARDLTRQLIDALLPGDVQSRKILHQLQAMQRLLR